MGIDEFKKAAHEDRLDYENWFTGKGKKGNLWRMIVL